MATLERAIAIAAEAHAGQLDKAGEPYILHVMRVVTSCRGEARIVAALHDVVEDCPAWPLSRLADEGFSGNILDAVNVVTRRRGESYAAFILRVSKNALARRVKLRDIEDNLDIARLPQVSKLDQERRLKYLDARQALLEAELRPACLEVGLKPA